jgi:hypothetical protein
MKVPTARILHRYTYDPNLIEAHGTPLLDTKTAQPVKPNTTVRDGNRILTPKQIVYILHHTKIMGALAGADPETITLPKFILFKDGNPANIRAENLQASNQTTRWRGQRRMVESVSGVAVPREFLGNIPPDMMDSLGISPDDINQ